VEPLAPHEKVFVDSSFAEDENHGQLGCEECHGGNPDDPDWKTAHEGVTRDPSYPDPAETCGACHDDIAEYYQKSLHVSLSPFKKTVDIRANRSPEIFRKVNMARETHCTECHSSCGQCHISRPNTAGGGFLEGHLFQKRPPVHTVCTACHGSRIEKEYFGKNKGIAPDIHRQKYFKCGKCHTADEMHGDGKDYANRYEVENGPKCLDCHTGIYEPKAQNAKEHWVHKDQVSCQVCHSLPYKNCSGCHVGRDKNGLPFYKTERTFLEFKIGLNPLKSAKRPERFVTLRRVPVAHGTFDSYTKNGLSNFDMLPVWKLATPHNIRRQTPQNKTCNACHGKPELFLLKQDIEEQYLPANKAVFVPPEFIPRKRNQ